MNWIPHFSSWQYAGAGLLCAAGPVVIHLLNRRRFRVIDWAAMDFVREAVQRERRVLRLRDLILLILRTAAVLLFGLALARPYLTADGSPTGTGSPRHLIVLIDNSLSMGYRPLDATLLDEAKQEARRLITALPEGSQVSVIDTCGRGRQRGEPWRRKGDALEALELIRTADRIARMEEVVAAARAALRTAAPLADQPVLITDLQRLNWPIENISNVCEPLPSLLIRDVGVPGGNNTWVADLKLRDDVADLDTRASILVSVRHHGSIARRVQVTLSIAQQVVASKTVEMSAGQSDRQVAFEHVFAETSVEPGVPTFVPVTASIAADRLPADDQRTMMVPVVAAVPVVFVDAIAADDENPAAGRLGETRPLRQLLAPVSAAGATERQLVDIRHVTVSQLNRTLLASARLVVMAGITDPGESVTLLREYVAQGGPLVIAAGGEFDPVAWNRLAWLEGNGVLPAPLRDVPVGAAPDDESGVLAPFVLDFDSLVSEPLLRLAGLSDEELQDVYREPLFFQAVAVDLGPPGARQVDVTDQGRPAQRPDVAGDPQPIQDAGLSADRWLTWRPPPSVHVDQPRETSAKKEHASAVARQLPYEVCARFTDPQKTPFLVRRRIGEGQVLFASTGLLPEWNNLSQTNAVVIWDHILRQLIRSTLPDENFSPQSQIHIALNAADRTSTVQLQRPGNDSPVELIDVGFVGREQYGVTIRDAWTRGVYRISPFPIDAAGSNDADAGPLWQNAIAVNGDPAESDLASLSPEEREEVFDDSRVMLIRAGESLESVAGDTLGQGYWWWLALVVLLVLLAELVILACWSS